MDCLTYNAAFELYEAGATVEMSLSTFSLIPVDLIADVPDTQSLFVSTSIPLSQNISYQILLYLWFCLNIRQSQHLLAPLRLM